MTEVENNITDGNLTQKEIIQLLLHNAQHMATREEVKTDIKDLKFELKEDISRVETSLKKDISRVEDKISKVSEKFDKIQWLIIATLIAVLSKDYLFSLMK